MKYLNRFNESINTNDIKLDTPFSELSIPSVAELISNSLKKHDVSVDIKKFYTDRYSLFISPHNSKKIIAVDIVKYMRNDNKTEVISEYYIDEKGDFIQGTQFKEDILNMKDFFIFISKYIPEIVMNRVIKKINESKKIDIDLDRNFKEMIFDEIIDYLETLSLNIGVEYKYGNIAHDGGMYFGIYYTDSDKIINVTITPNNEGSFEEQGPIVHVYVIYNKDTESQRPPRKEIFNMKDLIKYISKYVPGLANTKVMKKINESNKKVNIESKFILFLVSLEEWNSTNEHMYEIEQKWYSDDEVEEFEDSNHHVATLFENENEELIDNQDYDDITSISDSIEYFVQFRFSTDSENQMDFYVYENGEFREANGEEDSYFRGLDDECYLSDRPYIMSIEYDDWKKNKIDTINAIKKINR